MLMLVTGDNLMILFVGWEGVGLCSFLLINFWYTRIQANKAAMKAMIVNRIADIGLALGVFTIFSYLSAIDYDVIFSMIPYIKSDGFFCIYKFVRIIDAICFFLFIGAMGKSAQIGLHTWLPDAMEGPTPVSALIHAATMVTAGVFLLVRCSPIFEYSPKILNMITIVGATTAFFGATVGLLQNDLKRIIAYSTCSQLGYMIFACGVSNYGAAVFHLSNHAFFKALLFLSAGSVIHAMADEQDIRRMGGLRSLLPYTYSMFLIGNLALMGFPYLSGFYSKDLILESAYAKYTYSGHYAYWLGTFAAFLTAFYSTRLMHMTFLAQPNGYRRVVEHVHEAPIRMALPLGILAICSIFIGYLTKDMFVGLGTDFWGNAIFVHPYRSVAVDAEFVPLAVKDRVWIFSLSGMFWAFYFYEYFFSQLLLWKLRGRGLKIYHFLNRKWFFDKIINDTISQKFLEISYEKTYKILDKGVFELFGPTGLVRLVGAHMNQHARMYTGLIFHSSFMMLVGITLFITAYLITFYLGFSIETVVVVILIAAFTYIYVADLKEDLDEEDSYDPVYENTPIDPFFQDKVVLNPYDTYWDDYMFDEVHYETNPYKRKTFYKGIPLEPDEYKDM
jgi:NADH-ubiquinone oxidoreductase chain 5